MLSYFALPVRTRACLLVVLMKVAEMFYRDDVNDMEQFINAFHAEAQAVADANAQSPRGAPGASPGPPPSASAPSN